VIAIIYQGRPKTPPATQNVSQKFCVDKNKEVRGTKFKIVATRCHFKAKMHQIRLGLRPRPRWGSSQRSPILPIAGFEEVLLLREGKGMGGRGREGDGKKRKKGGRKEGRRGGRGKEGKGEGCVMAFGEMDAPGNYSY